MSEEQNESDRPAKDHLLLAIVAFFLCCPLGSAALYYSCQVRICITSTLVLLSITILAIILNQLHLYSPTSGSGPQDLTLGLYTPTNHPLPIILFGPSVPVLTLLSNQTRRYNKRHERELAVEASHIVFSLAISSIILACISVFNSWIILLVVHLTR